MKKKRKLIEKKLYAERRYITHKKYKHFIRAFYNFIKYKYYERRINMKRTAFILICVGIAMIILGVIMSLC